MASAWFSFLLDQFPSFQPAEVPGSPPWLAFHPEYPPSRLLSPVTMETSGLFLCPAPHPSPRPWELMGEWVCVGCVPPVPDLSAFDQRSPSRCWLQVTTSTYILGDAWRALISCNLRFCGDGVCLPLSLWIMVAKGSVWVLMFEDLKNMCFRWIEENFFFKESLKSEFPRGVGAST